MGLQCSVVVLGLLCCYSLTKEEWQVHMRRTNCCSFVCSIISQKHFIRTRHMRSTESLSFRLASVKNLQAHSYGMDVTLSVARKMQYFRKAKFWHHFGIISASFRHHFGIIFALSTESCVPCGIRISWDFHADDIRIMSESKTHVSCRSRATQMCGASPEERSVLSKRPKEAASDFWHAVNNSILHNKVQVVSPHRLFQFPMPPATEVTNCEKNEVAHGALVLQLHNESPSLYRARKRYHPPPWLDDRWLSMPNTKPNLLMFLEDLWKSNGTLPKCRNSHDISMSEEMHW